MLPGELPTAVAEQIEIVIAQNYGYASIGALSRSIGSSGFGTQYRRGNPLDNGAPAEPVAAVAADASGREAREGYARARRSQRQYVEAP